MLSPPCFQKVRVRSRCVEAVTPPACGVARAFPRLVLFLAAQRAVPGGGLAAGCQRVDGPAVPGTPARNSVRTRGSRTAGPTGLTVTRHPDRPCRRPTTCSAPQVNMQVTASLLWDKGPKGLSFSIATEPTGGACAQVWLFSDLVPSVPLSPGKLGLSGRVARDARSLAAGRVAAVGPLSGLARAGGTERWGPFRSLFSPFGKSAGQKLVTAQNEGPKGLKGPNFPVPSYMRVCVCARAKQRVRIPEALITATSQSLQSLEASPYAL